MTQCLSSSRLAVTCEYGEPKDIDIESLFNGDSMPSALESSTHSIPDVVKALRDRRQGDRHSAKTSKKEDLRKLLDGTVGYRLLRQRLKSNMSTASEAFPVTPLTAMGCL